MDTLISLQEKEPVSNLKIYDNKFLLDELKIFAEYYVPYALNRNLTLIELAEYQDIWQEILENQIPFNNNFGALNRQNLLDESNSGQIQ